MYHLVKEIPLQLLICALTAPFRNWAIIMRQQAEVYFAIFVNSEKRVASVFDLITSPFWSAYVFKTSLFPCAVIGTVQALYLARAAQYFYTTAGVPFHSSCHEASETLLASVAKLLGFSSAHPSANEPRSEETASAEHGMPPPQRRTPINRIYSFAFGVAEQVGLAALMFPVSNAHVILTLDITNGFKRSAVRLYNALYYARQNILWNRDLQQWDRREWQRRPKYPRTSRVWKSLLVEGIVEDITRNVLPIIVAHPFVAEALICQSCELWWKLSAMRDGKAPEQPAAGSGNKDTQRQRKKTLVRKYSRLLRVGLAVATTALLLNLTKKTERVLHGRVQPEQFAMGMHKMRMGRPLYVRYSDLLSVVVDAVPVLVAVLWS